MNHKVNPFVGHRLSMLQAGRKYKIDLDHGSRLISDP